MENEIMGEDLRMVILTDYIRKAAFTQLDGGKNFTNKLGVVPIFQLLRINLDRSFPLAILTGSLVVIPKAIEKELLALAEARTVAVTYKILPQDDAYISINVTQSNRSEIVAIMTDLLAAGHIRLVVGTAALLGEGWDAPCVNTLIMASYVGSFMLSNQMRGRAIRIDPEVEDKTGAIWHLGCVDDEQFLGGHDIYSLHRRFRSLVGLNVEEELVETGLHRMGDVFHAKFTRQKVTTWNKRTIELAKNRKRLDKRWQEAVSDVDASQQIQLRLPKKNYIRPFYFKYTIKALFMAALSTFMIVISYGVELASRGSYNRGIYFILMTTLVVAVLAALPKTIKAIMLAFRYVSVENFIEDVGKLLYETLYDLELVETAPKDVLVKMEAFGGGYVATIRGANTYEKNVYLKALQELLEPIDNPRYLLCRQPKRRRLIKPKPDYHAIPEEIARRKENASLFAEKWSKKFDPAVAIYTRSPEGRSILVKSRLAALSSKFVEKSEQISVWQ